MKANPIVWWELASHNAEKTADFLTGFDTYVIIFKNNS